MTLIGVINRAQGLNDRDVAFMAEAWNQQALEVAHAHEVEYTPVVFFGTAEGLPVDCRILTIKNEIDAPGALGFHDIEAGTIFAEVKLTGEVSITGSHEVAEETVDPLCARWAPFDEDHEQAVEVSDRVEGDSYLQAATVLGETRQIPVSNYLLPSAFDPDGRAPYDRMGLLIGRSSMTTGGYVIVRDITTGKVGNVFASRALGPRILAGPRAGDVLADKLAKRGSRLLRRLRA